MNSLWAPIFDLCARLVLFLLYILLLRFLLNRLCRHTAEMRFFKALAASVSVAGVYGLFTSIGRDPLGPAGIAGSLLAAWLAMRKLCWATWRETLVAGSLYAMLIVLLTCGYDRFVDRLIPQRETFLDRWEKSSETLSYLRRSTEEAVSWEWLFARVIQATSGLRSSGQAELVRKDPPPPVRELPRPPAQASAAQHNPVAAAPQVLAAAPGAQPSNAAPAAVAALPAPAVAAAAKRSALQRVKMPLDGFVSPDLYPGVHPSYRLLTMKGRMSASGGRQAVICNGRVVTQGATVTVDHDGKAWTWRLVSIGDRYAVWAMQDGGSGDETISW